MFKPNQVSISVGCIRLHRPVGPTDRRSMSGWGSTDPPSEVRSEDGASQSGPVIPHLRRHVDPKGV